MKTLSIRSMAVSIAAAAVLAIAGCGGGGSSSSGGSGGSFSTGGTMVKGNISSVNVALNSGGSGIGSYAYRVGNSLIAIANAEERAVGGIKVCIEDRCGETDANGNFEISLVGFPSGEYVMKLYVEEREYRLLIEVVANAVVTLSGISISNDGVVRVSNIRVEVIEDENEPPKEDYVVLCHKEEGQEPRTIEVPLSQKGAHLEHGDYLGECEGSPPGQHFLVCHVEGDDQVTLEVTAGGKAEHLEFHPNDYPGECESAHQETYVICHNPGPEQQTLEVTLGGKIEHLEYHEGDYLGECEPYEPPSEEKIWICHVGEGGQESLYLPVSQALEHLENHPGDDDGKCLE